MSDARDASRSALLSCFLCQSRPTPCLTLTPAPTPTHTTRRTTIAATSPFSWALRGSSSSVRGRPRRPERGRRSSPTAHPGRRQSMPTPLPRLSLQLAFLLSGTFTHAFRLGTRTPAAAGLCFPHRALSSSSSKAVSSLLSSTSGTSSSSSSLPSSLSSSPWGTSSSSSSGRRRSNAQSNRSVRHSGGGNEQGGKG